MIRKKVLVHGTLNSLKEFISSPFSKMYEPLAFISEVFEDFDTSNNGGGQNLLV